MYEVALGADIGAISEAHHYVNEVVTGNLPFLLTSRSSIVAQGVTKYFPDLVDRVSQELTPMVATARTIKQGASNRKSLYLLARVRQKN